MSEEQAAWSDGDVERKAAEIEDTREEMTGTVEAIGDRLDPHNIVEDAKSTVREATVGKVEKTVDEIANTAGDMVGQASDMVGQAGMTVGQAGGGIVETIRRNPIPAAMAGIGIGWLLMSSRSSSSTRGWNESGRRWGGSDERWTGDAWSYDDRLTGRGGYAAYTGTDRHPGVGDRIRTTASDASRGVADTASGAADTIGQTARDAADAARQVPSQVDEMAGDAGRLVEDNPLAAGAVALAIGAAIGLAMPSTRTERRVLGPMSQQAIDTAQSAIRQPMRQMEQQASQG